MTRRTLLPLLFLAAACRRAPDAPPPAPVDAGPARRAEAEPDDRPEQSMPLGDSVVVDAALTSTPARADEDWYLLFSDAPRLADVSVSGIPGVTLLLEAYDETRTRLAAVTGEGEGQPVRFPNLTVRGKLLVRVSAARRGGGGAYQLRVVYGEPRPGQEVEPNDRTADATELVAGGPGGPEGWSLQGLVGAPGDEDHYRLVLDPGTDGGVPDAGPGPSDAGLPGTPAGPAGPGGPAGTGATDALPRVGSGAEPSSSGGAVVEPPPEGFPSDAPPTAGLRPGTDAGTLPPEPPRVALRIELSAVPGVRPEVTVLSEAGAVLFTARGVEGQAFSQRNVGIRATDRIVEVVVKSAWSGTGKDARRGANPDVPYTLGVTREAGGANAEYEPNDDLAHATPLPLDGFREGFLTPKTDVDVYVLRPPVPSIARFELSGVDKLDLQLSVVEPGTKPGTERVVRRANDGVVKEPERLNSVACRDACYVKVEGAPRKVDGKWVRDWENAEVPYRLTVSTVPDTGAEEREPNDTPDTATPVALGKPIRGTVHPKKDVDWYRLDLSDRPVKTSLRATLTGILKVDVALYLYQRGDDGALTLVQTSDRAKGDAPEVIRYAAEPGVFLLKVSDVRNRESNFQDAYQLTVEEDAE